MVCNLSDIYENSKVYSNDFKQDRIKKFRKIINDYEATHVKK